MRGMQTWRWVPAALLLAMGGTAGRADEFAIQLLDKEGERIAFGAVDGATNYQVRTAPTPTGVWSVAVGTVPPTAANAVTATVSMAAATAFYQVVAYTNAPPAPPQGMVRIAGGTNSGTDPDPELGPYSLTVQAFWMGQYEVTNDEMVRVLQWAYGQGKLSIDPVGLAVRNTEGSGADLLVLGDGYCRITWDGSAFGLKDSKASGYPCIKVTWYGAAAYCNYRSEMEGRTPCYNLSDWSCNLEAKGYRLPMDTEWEYAARGGLGSARFPWGQTIDHTRANYWGWPKSSGGYDYDLGYYGYDTRYETGGEPYTSPVGSFPANGYGLYDMAGNAQEWMNDGPNSQHAYLRGGTWGAAAGYARCGYRDSWYRYWSDFSTGFRAVCR